MEYVVDQQYNQVRLDRWLRAHIKGVPQSLIEKSLRKKDILVNDKKASSSERLSIGDIIKIRKQIEVFDKPALVPAEFSKFDYAKLVDSIIHENENYLVLNKPRGFAVQGGSLVKKSVIDILNSQDDEKQYKIVHRIDKETTGILVIAKTMNSARYFAELFRTNNIKKTYLALVEGVIRQAKGILKNRLLKVHDKVIEDQNGKESIAEFEIISYTKDGRTLVKVMPVTGRMHQIRVQLSLFGYPIVGDRKYNSLANKREKLKLHAQEIEFVDMDDKMIKFIAPTPEDFEITNN